MIADDLFAGAGGWDLAAARLGIHPRGVENMKEARATRAAAGLTTIHDDVWTYRPDGTAAGLIASPPCQTFSKAGKGNGAKALADVLRGIRDGYCQNIEHLRFLGLEVGDERTALVLTPLHFALTGGYEWLAWEQVDTVLPVWEACAETLRGRGWQVWTGLLHSEQYGVPQTRKRAFLLASRTQAVAPPSPTHSRYYPRSPERLDEGVTPWVSMATALGGCPDVLHTGVNSAIVGPGPRRDELMAAGRWRECHKPQTRPTAAPSPTITSQTSGWLLRSPQSINGGPRAERAAGQPSVTVTSNFDRARFELPDWCGRRPSTTVVGSFRPDVIAAPGYRVDISRQNAPDSVHVTVSEAGVLQSFPADYPWQGAKGKQFLQCGNAVPPGMAAAALAAAAGIERNEAAA